MQSPLATSHRLLPLLLALALAGCDAAATPMVDGGAGSDAAWPPLDVTKIGAPVLVAASFQFSEGPLWDAKRQALLFSDIAADSILQLAPPAQITTFRAPSHQSNGLGFDKDGLLLAAEHESRSVTRTLANGTIVTVAGSHQGKKLNSPNDLIVRSDGTIYFTDPNYGLGGRPSEIGYMGLYRVDPGGTVHLEARIDGTPNGVALAPGEKMLWVAATTASQILGFDVAADGATSNQRALRQPVESPDGLAVDQGGNLYIAGLSGGRGAIIILDGGGTKLGEILLDHQPTNCGFGGAGGKTLYVTARAALYRIEVPIPGL